MTMSQMRLWCLSMGIDPVVCEHQTIEQALKTKDGLMAWNHIAFNYTPLEGCEVNLFGVEGIESQIELMSFVAM